MVAISLYKGNLRKATDVPRRWPSPAPKISLKDFKILLRRRARALSRLSTSPSDVATTSNPNPSPDPSCGNPNPSSARNTTTEINHVDNLCSNSELMVKGQLNKGEGDKEETGEDRKEVDEDSVLAVKVEKEDAEAVKNDGLSEIPVNKAVEKINVENATSDADKRSREVKEKLVVLNEKKHSLVQVLKQILSAEEHLKRQNCAQGMPSRPPLPLQVDTTTDSGSMIRVNTPRIGKDGNPCGDMEGGEADDVSNHNPHSRHLVRTSSCSPSSDSQQKKPFSNVVPHSYRTTLAVAGSPSRFAPAAQGPPSVSVSGASYIASSPSPAASGGTSVFRDGRLPSPWN
ncbi:hypothetical protein SASPL_155020 [Salvia splendens]|uniref:Uncharacterized protein n=1 Tax=Salvia splendens TaxID=180675 RepID=A0A8X8YZT5_SALSN|nr:uncharacterized protein LOC121786030 [Salvia splendens]KAG6386129.1 hypothetical protein SASPL_155020 [Salvia splendens]